MVSRILANDFLQGSLNMLSMYYYRSVYDTCQHLDKKIHALKGLTAREAACQAGADAIEGTLTGKNFLLMIPWKYYLCLLFRAETEGFGCVWLASLTGVPLAGERKSTRPQGSKRLAAGKQPWQCTFLVGRRQ